MANRFFEGSKHAALYSKFRPVTPDIVISEIVSFLKEKISSPLQQALDAGCGPGQSTRALAPYFQKVIGVDVSEAQISEANKSNVFPNVEYRAGPVEKLPLQDRSLQLVTACQSVHWFTLPDFYKEVDRLLVPSGVLAVYAYDLPLPVHSDQSIAQNAEKAVREHYSTMMEYFPHQRALVDNQYKDIELPYKDTIRKSVTYETSSTLSDYYGYVSSWSSYHRMKKEDPERADFILNRFRDRLKEALGATSEEMPITLNIEYFILMGRKSE